MARPREFEIEDAMEDAMNVFWDYGYDSASLPRLLDGMSLTRGSFYKAFSDKKSLFLDVLHRYETAHVTPMVQFLSDTSKGSGLDRINFVFERIPEAVTGGDTRGCLLCSAASGPASVDDDIAGLVHDMLGRMQRGFLTALGDPQEGTHLTSAERERLSHALVTNYVGLRVTTRARLPAETITQSIEALGEMLAATTRN